MLPIWIINLTEDEADKELLSHYIGSVAGQQPSFWYYTEIDSNAIVDGLKPCRTILNELVEKGRVCYSFFQKKKYKMSKFQICIIGNASEERTRTCFQILPLLLRKFMPLILGQYVHCEVEITGTLFVSHKINHCEPEDRTKCALFLEELNTLVNDLKSGFYNRIVVYQEIQRPDVLFYPELNKEQIQKLLFEILLHLFYIRNNQQKIFDLLPNYGFYSLGVASVYYNSREHKEEGMHRLFERLVKELKDPLNVSEKETKMMIAEKFPKENIAAENMLSAVQEDCSGPDVDLAQLEGEPEPHPLFGFYKAKLYSSYYLDYLSFLPARAAEFTRAYSRLLFGKLSVQIKKNRMRIVEKHTGILKQYDRIFQNTDCRYSTITQLKSTILTLKERLSEEREKAGKYALMEERNVFDIPDYLVPYYNEYRNQNERQTEKEILGKMKEALQSEPTILGLFSRCFLLGTMLVFILIPLLRYVSPFIVDLGEMARYELMWIFIIFLLPFAFSALKFRKHIQFVRKQKRILLAHALMKVQKKASLEVYKETNVLYIQLMAVCDAELKRYSEIEELLIVEREKTTSKGIPATTFNQSLVDGHFMGKKMLKDENLIALEVECEGATLKLSAMEKADYLGLLKELLRTPENSPFLSTTDTQEVPDLKMQVIKSLSEMRDALDSKITVNDACNVAHLLSDISMQDSTAITLEPMLSMAGINGAITTEQCDNGLIIRSAEEMTSSLLSQPYSFIDGAGYETEPVLFATYWSTPKGNKLNTVQICDTEPELPDSKVPFSTMVTCLFAKYKRKKNSYRIGKLAIPVTIGELERLDMDINNIKL